MSWPRTAVITGASSGIGEALARLYARRGASLVLVARREERLRRLAEALPGSHLPVACDVADRDQVVAMGARVRERFGGLDLLVNNAGVGQTGTFAETSYEEMERLVRVNLLGAISVTKELLPLLGRGSAIVNVASVAGEVGLPGESVYCATKFGLVGLSEALRAELADRGIRVIVVNPGAIATEGFPHDDLLRSPVTRRFVLSPEQCAAQIVRAVDRGRPTAHVPAYLGPLVGVARTVAGPLLRRAVRLLP